jgi:hypothetical protein
MPPLNSTSRGIATFIFQAGCDGKSDMYDTYVT